MSVADEIQKLIPSNQTEHKKTSQQAKHDQLEQLAEVEKNLAKLGISLEPKFEIALNSRFVVYEPGN